MFTKYLLVKLPPPCDLQIGFKINKNSGGTYLQKGFDLVVNISLFASTKEHSNLICLGIQVL